MKPVVVQMTGWKDLELWLQLMPKEQFIRLEELMEKVRADRTREAKK